MKSIISFIVKFVFLLFLLLFISGSYFVLLITTEQKSFPFLTNRVESHIAQHLQQNDNIEVGNIRIEQNNFNIIAHLDQTQITYSKSFIEIPKIKLSFSIFDLISLKTEPKNIEIKNANIKYHSYLSDKISNKLNIKLNDILPDFLDGNFRKINIDNINLTLLKDSKKYDIQINDIDLEVKNDKSILSMMIKHRGQNILAKNQCYIIKYNSICDIVLSEIDPYLVKDFFPFISNIGGITTKISSNISFKSNDKEDDVSFSILADSVAINNKHLFQDKIYLNNLFIFGNYNLNKKSLKIKDFNSQLDGDIALSGNIIVPHISKSRYDVTLKLNNVNKKDIPRLWPILIPNDDDIKKWILRHIKSFNIKDAIIMMKFDNKKMIDIDAKFSFKNAALVYNRYFPTIHNVIGRAYFGNKSMSIVIDDGYLLKSRIRDGEVKIDDFFAKTIELNIKGRSSGRAEDLLKHINYKSDFAKNIGNYVNGFAKSYINLSIPLKRNLTIKDIYLQSYSRIKNINNNFVDQNSDIYVKLTKKINSDIFHNEIDLTRSNIEFKPLSIAKKTNINSKLFFDINAQDGLLKFNNIKFDLDNSSFLSGSFVIDSNNQNIQSIDLTNPNFTLSYNIDNRKSVRNLSLKGKELDLNSFKSMTNIGKNNFKYHQNNIEIILDNLILANNIQLQDIDINIRCDKSLCINSFIKANMNQNNIIDVDFKPYPIKKITKINGRVADIAPIIKGFDLYDKIISGDLIIKADIKPHNNNQIISGEVYNKSKYKVLKGKMIQQISEDDLFSNIEKELSQNDQLTFDDLHSEFNIKNNILEIEKFIISNNYLGITAKGNVMIDSGKIDIRGLIIPGYLINRLFGIGDLPIIKYISLILIGEKGGGIFAGKYQLYKNAEIDNNIRFQLNKASIFAPGAIRNFFD